MAAKNSLQLNPNRRRFTKQQIEQRRLGVWEMYICGQPIHEIAHHFGVVPKTISRDIAWWEKQLGDRTEALKNDPAAAAIEVGMTAAKLAKVAEDAYVEYTVADKGTTKVRFLQTVIQALVSKTKVQQETGFLPKVGHEKERAPEVNISFEARFGTDSPQSVFDDSKSRRRVLEAAYAIYKTASLEDAGTLGGEVPNAETSKEVKAIVMKDQPPPPEADRGPASIDHVDGEPPA
jgi:hypothetical protein